MSLISRGCYRGIKTGAETLTSQLLDAVRIDEAAETARGDLHAAIDAGLLTSRPQPAARTPAAPSSRASAPTPAPASAPATTTTTTTTTTTGQTGEGAA